MTHQPDRNLALDNVWVSQVAALAASKWIGRGDNMAADRAATEAMRRALRQASIRGTVRIGEGERDEAPMLYIGEKVGRWAEPNAPVEAESDHLVDIAVDPLENTNGCAKNMPGSICAIAFAEDGGFLNAPDIYMAKIAVGPEAKDAIDLRLTPRQNLEAIAEAKGVRVGDLNVVVLERDRHARLIQEIHEAGARVTLILDGDLMAAIATADPSTDIDVLMGIGGAPEGVLAAAALRARGGNMQGRLMSLKTGAAYGTQVARAKLMTGREIEHIYSIDELAGGDVGFVATGVTDGPVLKGIRESAGGVWRSHSIVMRSKTRTLYKIEAEHQPHG
jgi:fructose-1,6-bisphosphatase II